MKQICNAEWKVSGLFKKFSAGEGGGMSLTTTMFTKEVFIQALQEYYNKTRK